MPTSAPSSSTQKKCKREKKDKSKRLDTSTLSDSTLTASSAATSAVPTPLSTTRAPTPTAPTPADVSAYLKAHNITIHTPSSSTAVVPMLSFSQLDEHIPQALRDALKSFKEPTPIQACAWPTTLRGDDVVGIAETGSGKTLAFGIPAIARIAPSTPQCVSQNSKKSKGKSTTTASISALVIAPTRELAIQTHDTMTMLGEPFGLRSIAVFGGVDKEPQKRALREAGAAVVVGTPGRIMDLMDEGVCDLSRVTYLVLDEADRMLDKGFENDIRKIMKGCAPVEQRQTLMFSATWPEAVRRLAATFQRNPIRITVGSDDLTANSRVEQTVEVFDDQREKDSRLTAHLRALQHKKTSLTGSDEKRILVFALYKKEASRVEQTLRRAGYAVGSIHGDLSQAARMESLEAFKSGKTGLLVATDVASRGLDIPNVGTVINYTFPLTVEDYIHRIGRTGRGGKSGKAITFFTGDGHERGLAGELAKILRDGGFDAEPLKKFPMTIKKKEHGAYGAFYKDTSGAAAPKRLKFT
ncbi:DEAD-domain-containing protein [Rickenella mellea]|uniref:RNA helicase n=1 Tax=Rickenella mellea TaxID=50990 RepID=A0A4Y7QPD9_9AGAM|nr:DEAD-domain-containing protein [Rickenella mellea]